MRREGEAEIVAPPSPPPPESMDDIEAVHHRHVAAVTATVRRLIGDEHATQDVVQETFLRAWRRRDTFDPARGPLRAWLLLTARSCAVDHLRRRRARPWQRALVPPELVPSDLVDDPYEAVLAAWVVETEIRLLPETHRRVIVETHLRDRPYAEVAAELGIPVGTVRSRVHHALLMLRASLDRKVDPS